MTLVHKLAFVFLFGALCWSAPTRHSPSTDEVTGCSGLHSLPPDLFEGIAESLPAHVLASLAQTDNYTHGLCKPDLTKRKAPKLEFHIGKTPTFMPAVKRCLMYDDLSCYNLVLQSFTVEKHHLAQMPALAAQLGASKIFRSFGKKASDPLWYHWMTRALIRFRFDFLKQVAGILPHPDIARVVDKYLGPPAFYDNLSNNLKFTKNIVEPSAGKTLQLALARTYARYGRVYQDWIVEDIVTNQPPIWKNIFGALKRKNKREREEALLELKNKIVDILSQGVYVIDDIMLNTLNTHRLWEKYVKPRGNKTDDRSDFVMWLIAEGSPISDMVFVDLLTWQPKLKPKFERELQMAVQYASGSVTASLVNQLRINSQDIGLNPMSIAGALPTYKDVLHANFSDPIVLKYAKILVKTKRTDVAGEVYRNQVKDFFEKQGHDLSGFSVSIS